MSLQRIISEHLDYIESTTKGPVCPLTPDRDLRHAMAEEEQKVCLCVCTRFYIHILIVCTCACVCECVNVYGSEGGGGSMEQDYASDARPLYFLYFLLGMCDHEQT